MSRVVLLLVGEHIEKKMNGVAGMFWGFVLVLMVKFKKQVVGGEQLWKRFSIPVCISAVSVTAASWRALYL